MTTGTLIPALIYQGYTSNGQLNAFGFLATYAAGTTSPLATFADPGLTQQNPNPVPLNAIGQASIWLTPGIGYKFVETDQFGNQCGYQDQVNASGVGITSNVVPALNNTFTIGTPAFSWAQLYVDNSPIVFLQTRAELAAGIVPINVQYEPGSIDRYGTNTTPGVTSMAAALQAAINQANKAGGATVSIGLTAPYLIDASMDCTTTVGTANYGIIIRGIGGQALAVTDNPNPYRPVLIFKTTGHAFDTTGSQGITVEDLSISTDLGIFPQTCFLLARNSDGSSRSDRFTNVRVFGLFSSTIIYNYGAEDDQYTGCAFYNANPASGTSVYDITAYNIRGLSSTFTTIATGGQSCLDHKIFGGEWANLAGTNTSDVIRVDASRSIKLFGPWMDSSTGSVSGRSLIYIDGTNGPTQIVELIGIDGEAGAAPSTYGIFFSNNAQTHSNFLALGNTFPNITAMLGGGTGATLTQSTWLNNTNQSTGGGVVFSGTLTSFQNDAISNISPLLGYNETFGTAQGIVAAGEADFSLRDTTQATGSQVTKLRSNAGGITISTCDNSGNVTANILTIPKGVTQSGWGTPTGAVVVNNFSGGAATLVNCSNAIAEIITMLKTIGLFSA
jgi:hypothetical protein